MKKNKAIVWLYKELPKLIQQGILDNETAQKVIRTGRKYAQDNLGRERILINFERQLVALLGAKETRIQ